MRKYEKPSVVVSACLEFDSCRYNGELIPNSFVKELKKHVKFIPVCLEMEIGLGVPHEPVRIVKEKSRTSLVQPATEKDFSDKMNRFSLSYLKKLKEIDGFILRREIIR